MGMTGHKKVSDILIDQKVNRFDKQNTLVLLSGNKIIWVVGRVISEEFKITNATKKVLFIKSQNRYSNPPQHQ
jgi:tRNA(Ile)-lysidine synthase